MKMTETHTNGVPTKGAPTATDKIAKKLALVAKACGFGVPHDAQNEHFRYKYTSASAIKKAVGPHLAAQHVAVSQRVEVLSESFTHVMLKVDDDIYRW